MAAPSTALTPSGESIAPYVLVAVLGHAGLLCGLVLIEALYALIAPAPPLVDMTKVIEITGISMPAKEFAEVPRNATRTAAPPPPTAELAPPAPSPEAPLPPPPPVQSELAFQKPTAPTALEPTKAPPAPQAAKTQPEPVDRSAERDAAMRDLKMASLLDDLGDPGTENRTSQGPNVDSRASGRTTFGSGAYDPDLSPYAEQIRRILKDHFAPLPVLKGKGLSVTLSVKIDDTGRVLGSSVKKSSGNPSFDQSAIAATTDATLPRPPQKLQDGVPQSFDAVFTE
jgi:protein TonB